MNDLLGTISLQRVGRLRHSTTSFAKYQLQIAPQRANLALACQAVTVICWVGYSLRSRRSAFAILSSKGAPFKLLRTKAIKISHPLLKRRVVGQALARLTAS